MPITNMRWSRDWNRDRHVLRGQTSPDLSAGALVFDHDNDSDFASVYQAAHPGDVTLSFTPLFKGVKNGNLIEAPDSGLHFDMTTGALHVDTGAPARPKFNFIVEVLAKNTTGGLKFTEVIRFHVHATVTRMWLTPSTMTIHPLEELTLKDPPYRFTVRAEFDDGSVGDLTLKHGVTWAPPFNFASDSEGLVALMPTDVPGHDIAVTATLPTPAGPQTANATVHVGPRWSEAPNLPAVGIVPGAGWPGTLKPEVAPNVLFLGSGFPHASKDPFEQITNSFVHFMKSDSMMRPFDLLATSINFWRTFVDSPFGISVRSEVWTRVENGKTLALPVQVPAPAVGAAKWELENMIYAVGLPVAADAGKPDEILKQEWTALLKDDPVPNLTDSLIARWKKRANRTFIDEIDAFPSMSYGVPPAVNKDFGNLLNLHPDRGGVEALKQLYRVLTSDSGVALDGGKAIGNLWATTDPAWHFDNTDLVVLVSSFPSGRALNGTGYIAISASNGDIDLPVKSVDGRNAFTLKAIDIPQSASADSCRTMTHELAHSFGLGDEYEADVPRRQQNQEETFDNKANLTTKKHAQDGHGNFSGDEIRWNWHRIRKAGLIDGSITEPSPGVFKIPLRMGDGLQFETGDKLLLRVRERHTALPKHPTVLATAKQLEIGIAPTADSILATAAAASVTTLADLIPFAAGSIVYVPTPAPASAAATTPFAEMIALNVKKEITVNNRSLTPVLLGDKIHEDVQVPDLKNITIRGCFSHKTRIIGLYEGGNLFTYDVYHPAGECMMRQDHVESAQFCAVCRYIIVDFVNPFLHWQIDRDYAKIYPQPD
jgi:hypothetical protein